jgi:hypothetical protein
MNAVLDLSDRSRLSRVLQFFKETRALIIGLLSFVVALIRFFRGIADLSEQLFVISALIAAWIASMYVARSQSTTEITLTDGRSQAYVYQRWIRRTAGIFAVCCHWRRSDGSCGKNTDRFQKTELWS